MRIRRSVYVKLGEPITLAFVACIADHHPEHIEAAPPPPEPEWLAIERPPRWSEKLIRRTMGRDRKHTARLINRFGDQATVRRIEPESA